MNQEDENIINKSIQKQSVDFFETNFSKISKCGEYKILDIYNYYENNCEYIFYDSYYKVYFDKFKNIIMLSNHIFQNIYYIKQNIDKLLSRIKLIDIDDVNIPEIDEILAIQTWAETYGHFMDEALNLYDFKDKFNKLYNKNLPVLLNFKEPNLYNNDNYNKIMTYLFDNKVLNAKHYLPKYIIKIKKIYIIKNSFCCKTFHNFPLNSSSAILLKIEKLNILTDGFNKNLFISRDGSGWSNERLLVDKLQIEKLISDNNYQIVYPELLDYDLFIKKLNFANKIIINWGSSLVNIIYLKPYTKVLILKSKSYVDEQLTLFEKLIKNYNVQIIDILDESKYDTEMYKLKITSYLK